jgi:hypothetical protein
LFYYKLSQVFLTDIARAVPDHSSHLLRPDELAPGRAAMAADHSAAFVRGPDPRQQFRAGCPRYELAVAAYPDLRTSARLEQLDRFMNWTVGGLLLASVVALVLFQAQ